MKEIKAGITGRKPKYLRIKIVKVNGRLRAVAEIINESMKVVGKLGEWWIESRSHIRYMPFKPIKPKVEAILMRLSNEMIEKIAMFLLTADEGEELIVRIDDVA